ACSDGAGDLSGGGSSVGTGRGVTRRDGGNSSGVPSTSTFTWTVGSRARLVIGPGVGARLTGGISPDTASKSSFAAIPPDATFLCVRGIGAGVPRDGGGVGGGVGPGGPYGW